MSYESGKYKGVILPQKEQSRYQRQLPCNGKVECWQVLRDDIQCEIGVVYGVALSETLPIHRLRTQTHATRETDC